MHKKLQVFVSSTYTDLQEERQAAVSAILDAGHIPAGMELFKGGKSQLETIYKWIDESDVYILILGGRYGSIENESGLSYTQLEYEYALSKEIPMFSIVLKDSFLDNKMKQKSYQDIWEQNAPGKYQAFKSLVQSKLCHEVDDCKDIKLKIISNLNDLSQNSNLNGWVRSDQLYLNYDFSQTQYDNLFDINRNIFHEILLRNYPSDLSKNGFDLSEILSEQLKSIITSSYGLLTSSERLIKINFTDKAADTLKITITKIWEYAFLDYKSHPFNIKFIATEQQAKSYRNIALTINGCDYTSMVKLTIQKVPDFRKFNYIVFSNNIPFPEQPTKIIHVSSYECAAVDFFQTHRLSSLCKQFKAYITLSDEVREKYTLISATFSPFSVLHYDDHKAGEISLTYDEQISLPTWSLPGSGYVISLKPKV